MQQVVYAEYAVLSHCWGDPQSVAKTIQSILTDHTQQIPLSILSNTFRDAVRTCRKLGVQYLWIDSLYIVQDDPGDWDAQGARMTDIYTNASLTIAAADSKDGSGGCFYTRDNKVDVQLDNQKYFPRWTEPAERLPLRKHWRNCSLSGSACHPLFGRKWCLQERMLSRCIIYFTRRHPWWECREEAPCG